MCLFVAFVCGHKNEHFEQNRQFMSFSYYVRVRNGASTYLTAVNWKVSSINL